MISNTAMSYIQNAGDADQFASTTLDHSITGSGSAFGIERDPGVSTLAFGRIPPPMLGMDNRTGHDTVSVVVRKNGSTTTQLTDSTIGRYWSSWMKRRMDSKLEQRAASTEEGKVKGPNTESSVAVERADERRIGPPIRILPHIQKCPSCASKLASFEDAQNVYQVLACLVSFRRESQTFQSICDRLISRDMAFIIAGSCELKKNAKAAFATMMTQIEELQKDWSRKQSLNADAIAEHIVTTHR